MSNQDSTPDQPLNQPLDIQGTVDDSRVLRWALTGSSRGGDPASAVYGTILAASLLIASFGNAYEIFFSVIGTGIVVWLAHAHVNVMRSVVRGGKSVEAKDVLHTLAEEWPLAQASLSPAAPMILAMLGILSTDTAADLGLIICFASLIAWGIDISRAAKLSRRATVFTIGINVGLGLMLVILRAILH